MNCLLTRQNLHTGLSAVSASIPTKTTLPVLSNILFEAGQDGIWLSGTDLDVAVRVWVAAEVKEQGSITAPGKKLQEIVRELAEQPVELSTRGEQIELRCGKSHFKLNGLPSDAFPTLPEVDFESGWSVKGHAFRLGAGWSRHPCHTGTGTLLTRSRMIRSPSLLDGARSLAATRTRWARAATARSLTSSHSA